MRQLAILLSIAFLFTSCDSILSPESSTTDKSQQPSPQIMQSPHQSGQGRWERQESGTNERLNDVHFVNDQIGWTVNNRTIRHTTDGGQIWQQQESFDGGFRPTTLWSVHFVDARTGWVAGWRDSVVNRTQHFEGVIFHTKDGGRSWTEQSINLDQAGQVGAVYFVDRNIGWAVGRRDQSNKGYILHSTDGGETWMEQEYEAGRLNSVHFVDKKFGWAVGGLRTSEGIIVHTSDGGVTWNKQIETEKVMASVHFVNRQIGWVTGVDGTILHTSDGGQTWQRQESGMGTKESLPSVRFVNSQTGWVVGGSRNAGGFILHTTDGGQTWNQEIETDNDLRSVHFVDTQNGWAVGDRGTILHYSEEEEPPPPESSAQTIYEEQLNDPWIDASWNASVNYSSSERVRSGSRSIRVEQNAWGALSTRSGRWGDSQDISPGQYKQVTFAVYAPDQQVQLDLRLQNSGGDDFPRVRYGTVEAGSWTVVSVSLVKLNPNGRSWNRLVVSESSGSSKTYFVDDLKLSGNSGDDSGDDDQTSDQEDLTVYQNELTDPWIDASWNAAVDYQNNERTHAGSSSIRVKQDPWGALSTRSGQWGNPKNIKPGQYERVKFAIYASEQPATIDLILENDQGDEFPRVRYGTVKAGSWASVSVPLAELNPEGHPYNRIDIAESSGAARTYFVDDLKLAGSSGSGQMATNN